MIHKISDVKFRCIIKYLCQLYNVYSYSFTPSSCGAFLASPDHGVITGLLLVSGLLRNSSS
jgi:hypothetical protein